MNSAYEKYFKSDIEQFEKSLKSIDVIHFFMGQKNFLRLFQIKI